jgi:hypothetical protein
MDDYGTLIMAMKHPELISAAAPLRFAVFTNKRFQNMPKDNHNRTFSGIYGQHSIGPERLNAHWNQNSILKIVETAFVDSPKK